MRPVNPEAYRSLLESVEEVVGKLSHRYPVVEELRKLESCVEDRGFYLVLTLNEAERAEAILRSVIWDLPDPIREELREVVRRWERCLS